MDGIDEVPRTAFEVVRTEVRRNITRLTLRRPSGQVFPLRAGQYVAVPTGLVQICGVGEGSVDIWDESGSLWGVDVRRMVRVRQWPTEDGRTQIEW